MTFLNQYSTEDGIIIQKLSFLYTRKGALKLYLIPSFRDIKKLDEQIRYCKENNIGDFADI